MTNPESIFLIGSLSVSCLDLTTDKFSNPNKSLPSDISQFLK